MSLVDLLGKHVIEAATSELAGHALESAEATPDVARPVDDPSPVEQRLALLRLEIADLERRKNVLAGDVALERAALRTVREEVLAELDRADKLHESAARAEMDASLHRLTGEDAIRRADEARASLAESEERLIQIRSEELELLDRIAVLRARHDDTEHELDARERALRARLATVLDQIADAEGRHERLQVDLQVLQTQRSEVVARLAELGIDEVTAESATFARQAFEVQLVNAEREAELRRTEAMCLQQQVEEARRTTAELEERQRHLVQKSSTLERSIAACADELDRRDDDIRFREHRRAELEALCSDLERQRIAAEAAIDQARKEHQRLAVDTAGRTLVLANRAAAFDDEVARAVAEELQRRISLMRSMTWGQRRAARRRMSHGEVS